jgi:hypothetical protein
MAFDLLEDLLHRNIRAAAQERLVSSVAVVSISHFEISFLKLVGQPGFKTA